MRRPEPLIRRQLQPESGDRHGREPPRNYRRQRTTPKVIEHLQLIVAAISPLALLLSLCLLFRAHPFNLVFQFQYILRILDAPKINITQEMKSGTPNGTDEVCRCCLPCCRNRRFLSLKQITSPREERLLGCCSK